MIHFPSLDQSQDPLVLLNDEFQKYSSDKEKFVNLLTHQGKKRDKLTRSNTEMSDTIAQLRA